MQLFFCTACIFFLLFLISSSKRTHDHKRGSYKTLKSNQKGKSKSKSRTESILSNKCCRYNIHDAGFTVGMVRQYIDYQEYLCAGVIISKHWALTSPSCAHKPSNAEILLGKVVLRGGTKYIEGTSGFEHNIYQIKLIGLLAFVEVKDPFIHYPYETRVPLIASRFYNFTSAQAEVFGWGETIDQGVTTQTLKDTKVQLIHNKQCNNEYKSITQNSGRNVICGVSLNNYGCAGHVGGPLMQHNVLIGISLKAYDCNGTTPQIYARISAYDWIIFTQTMDFSLQFSPPLLPKPH